MGILKILLPYNNDTTDQISRISKKWNILVDFIAPNTIRRMVDSKKDLVDPRYKKGMHSIPFSCGKVYIGETCRLVQILLKDNAINIFNNKDSKSPLA